MDQPPPKRKQNFRMIKFAPFRTSWEEIIRVGTFTLRGVLCIDVDSLNRAGRPLPLQLV